MSGIDTAPSKAIADRDRKAEHIALALDARMQFEVSFFSRYRFEHVALPEIDMDEIDLSVQFLGRRLAAPLLISCMTGGTEEATRINHHLARAAESTGVAVGVGSQRKAIEDPALAASFQVRELAPSVPLLANLGAVQLNYGWGVAECRAGGRDDSGADALVLHLNPLQEAIQPEGASRLQRPDREDRRSRSPSSRCRSSSRRSDAASPVAVAKRCTPRASRSSTRPVSVAPAGRGSKRLGHRIVRDR